MKTAILAAVLTAGLLAGTAPVLAAETARASATITIYAGPGTDYRAIGKLPKNARVSLKRCTRSGNWCLFEDNNGNAAGWVRASYLIGIGAITRATPFQFLVNPDVVRLPR